MPFRYIDPLGMSCPSADNTCSTMFHPTVIIPVLILGFLSVRGFIKKRRNNPQSLPLPPGPPRLPIVGNLFGIKDLGAQWLTYAEWSKEYGTSFFLSFRLCLNDASCMLGDLLYLEILGQKILVINSEDVAADLLDKRSQNYSDRPQVPMVTL